MILHLISLEKEHNLESSYRAQDSITFLRKFLLEWKTRQVDSIISYSHGKLEIKTQVPLLSLSLSLFFPVLYVSLDILAITHESSIMRKIYKAPSFLGTLGSLVNNSILKSSSRYYYYSLCILNPTTQRKVPKKMNQFQAINHCFL